MKFRNLDQNNDWVFGKGKQSYAITNEAIGLDIKTALQSWVGDCFFALYDYVDWHARLDKNQENNLKNELYSVIINRYGVVAVNTLNIELNPKRQFIVIYEIQTIFSKITDSFITGELLNVS